jgi:glycine/D-amino acid oxidase-like deaminating enzyme
VADPTAALAGSVARPLWLDTPDRPDPRPALHGDVEVDLAVVGGGFTGLWTALCAVERAPGTRVVVLEADRITEHATGRNGGFCESSLTHGEANGRDRWPEEYDVRHRLGLQNLDAIEETVARYAGWSTRRRTSPVDTSRGSARSSTRRGWPGSCGSR